MTPVSFVARNAIMTMQNIILLTVLLNYMLPDFVSRMVKAFKDETVPPPTPLPINISDIIKQQTQPMQAKIARLEQLATRPASTNSNSALHVEDADRLPGIVGIQLPTAKKTS